MDNKLLNLRKQMKKKKPVFVRQQGEYVPSLKKKQWRAPKGMHSKLRRKRRGRMKHPSPSYSSPTAVKYMHPSGLIPILISNIEQLSQVQNYHGVIVSRLVGVKKRIALLKKCQELKLSVLNIKNVSAYLTIAEEKRKTKLETKKKKILKKDKITETPQAEKIDISAEEKEKQDKENKRKILESPR